MIVKQQRQHFGHMRTILVDKFGTNFISNKDWAAMWDLLCFDLKYISIYELKRQIHEA